MAPRDEPGLGRGQWMALTAALLGWMFDGLEMGLFPLVARPALRDLLGVTDDKLIGLWFGVATAGFLVGAATGGVLFGWLGDRIGRVRAMTLSILTYAVFSGLCGLSHQSAMLRDFGEMLYVPSAIPIVGWLFLVLGRLCMFLADGVHQIAVLRFLSALGMGGEWSLGVALVMEIWPDRSRAWLAGLIGAAANLGFLAVGVLALGLALVLDQVGGGLRAIGLPEDWVAWLVANSGWRLLLMMGALPALLTFFIRLFVPESERWAQEKERGTTSNWATQDLLGVLVGAAGACGIIYLWAEDFSLAIRIPGSLLALSLAILGYLYPVIRYLQRSGAAAQEHARAWFPIVGRMLMGAALGGVALLGTWASLQWAPVWADQLTRGEMPEAKVWTQMASAIGAIVGTIAAALAGNWLNRRVTYFLLCLASLVSALAFFQLNRSFGPMFLITVFLAGGFTASFYGWLPLYLPELFRTAFRATGQGFSFNFGRILAAIGTLQAGYLVKEVFQQDYATACSIMSLIYLVGMIIIWFAPETRGKPLPE